MSDDKEEKKGGKKPSDYNTDEPADKLISTNPKKSKT